MHRLCFPPALTDPLLPFKQTHSSALVVWGCLGRAIPCLMSSEAKISVLASEWLASLWALLPERNQWVLFFFLVAAFPPWSSKEQRRERARKQIYPERQWGGWNEHCISVVMCKPIFSSSGWGDFWVHGFPTSKSALHTSWKSWHFGGEESLMAKKNLTCMRSLSKHEAKPLSSYCKLVLPEPQLTSRSPTRLPLCRETQAGSLTVAGLSQPLPPN